MADCRWDAGVLEKTSVEVDVQFLLIIIKYVFIFSQFVAVNLSQLVWGLFGFTNNALVCKDTICGNMCIFWLVSNKGFVFSSSPNEDMLMKV